MTTSRRLHHIQRHVQSHGSPHDTTTVSISPTRSLSEWGSDLWAMATKDVVITERHGGDLVADVLRAHHVEYIFCLSGGHISPFLVSSKREGIRIIDVRHEVNAVFAADAVGRLTGRPGVAAVTAGPGVTNTVTAIKNCQMAQSPLVLLGGAAATVMQGRGALQDIDQIAVLKPIVKWCASCRTARDIVPTLRRAFQEAQSGVPGPVFVELPLDVLYPTYEMLAQDGTHSRLRAKDLAQSLDDQRVMSRVVLPIEATERGQSAKQYLQSRAADSTVLLKLPPAEQKSSFVQSTLFDLLKRRLYAGAFAKDAYPDLGPLPVHIPKPTVSDVSRACGLLAKAKRPLLIIGSQATLLGEEKTTELARAVEAMGIPCFLGGMARGMLGRNHRLHIRQNRGAALRQCDMVIMLGVIADFRLDYGRGLPKNVPIVTANRSLEDLTKNAGIFWNPTIAAQCDGCLFLLQLARAFNKRRGAIPSGWADFASQLKQSEVNKEAKNRATMQEPAVGHGRKSGMQLINPLYLCQQLEDVLPDDSVLVADGGDFVATASYIVRPRGPLRWLDPGAFGTLGVGGGFALGAKLVRPNTEVWLIWGDGSAGYSIMEYDTFTRHDIPVIGLVGNDACWTQIAREQVPMFQDDAACMLDYLQYHVSAEGIGGVGFELKSPADDIKGVMQEAQRIVHVERKPVLINAHIGKTNFREGSLSV